MENIELWTKHKRDLRNVMRKSMARVCGLLISFMIKTFSQQNFDLLLYLKYKSMYASQRKPSCFSTRWTWESFLFVVHSTNDVIYYICNIHLWLRGIHHTHITTFNRYYASCAIPNSLSKNIWAMKMQIQVDKIADFFKQIRLRNNEHSKTIRITLFTLICCDHERLHEPFVTIIDN